MCREHLVLSWPPDAPGSSGTFPALVLDGVLQGTLFPSVSWRMGWEAEACVLVTSALVSRPARHTTLGNVRILIRERGLADVAIMPAIDCFGVWGQIRRGSRTPGPPCCRQVLVKLVAHTQDEGTHPRITVLSYWRDLRSFLLKEIKI